MSKKKPKKKFSVEAPSVFPFKSKNRYKIILGVIVLGFLVFFVIRQVQIYQEKADYRQAETVLEQLYKEIEGKIGKPDGIERKKACYYSSAKFSKGTRRCSVSIDFSFSVKDRLSAADLANRINATLTKNSDTDIIYKNYGDKLIFEDSTLSYSTSDPSADFSINNSRRCSFSYMYRQAAQVEEVFNDTSLKNSSDKLIIYMACGGEAKSEYFPVLLR